MQCFFHRNALKTSAKQPFILFKPNLSKPCKDLLLQLQAQREKILKLFQESNRNKIERCGEELNHLIANYISLFRGFVISPLHDLGGISENVSEIVPSPLCKMYTFSWSDSLLEGPPSFTGNSFVEVFSMLFNYGIWLMKWCSIVYQVPNDGNCKIKVTNNPTITYLVLAAGIFRFCSNTLSKFLLQLDIKIFGTDLDPSVIQSYEHQCYGEAYEFAFLSLMGDRLIKQQESSTGRNDSLLELIELSRLIRQQFLQCEELISLIPERRYRKWQIYCLMKKLLFQSWEYVLIIHEKFTEQPSIYLNDNISDEKVLWEKYEQSLLLINRLCIKYNKYGKEFGKNSINSWVNRTIDFKKFTKNLSNYVGQVRDDIRNTKPNSAPKKVIINSLVGKIINWESYHLPKLHELWSITVCLELGIEIFLPNYDPTLMTSINIKLSEFMPIWSEQYTNLKNTIEIQNFNQAIAQKCSELRKACLRLKEIRDGLISFDCKPSSTIDNLAERKEKMVNNFKNYSSWLGGFLDNDCLRYMFAFSWTNSINSGLRFVIYDAEYEMCCNIFNIALWILKSVDNIMNNLKVENENIKCSEMDYMILSLKEAAGMFQFLMDRTKSFKYISNADYDFTETVLKCYRNNCIALAEELLFLTSNINWIQLKISIRIMQLYWTISEDLGKLQDEPNKLEREEKLKWRLYCQIKSYLYKSFGYFFLSEMFSDSGENSVGAMQKCQTLYKYFKKEIAENTNKSHKWLLENSKLNNYAQYIEKRYQTLCMHFVLNNYENFMNLPEINLDRVDVNKHLDLFIHLQPIKFFLPPTDDYWTKDAVMQKLLLEMNSKQQSTMTNENNSNSESQIFKNKI